MAISDDQPISTGNLKAIIPKIIAHAGAFTQGYWNGSFSIVNKYVTFTRTGTNVPMTITPSDESGRIKKTGEALLFPDGGTYQIACVANDEDSSGLSGFYYSFVLSGDSLITVKQMAQNATFQNTKINESVVIPAGSLLTPCLRGVYVASGSASGMSFNIRNLTLSDVTITRIE